MSEKLYRKSYLLIALILTLYLITLEPKENSSLYTDSFGEEAESDVIEQFFPEEPDLTVRASDYSDSNTWTNMDPLGSKPSARYTQAMAYDATHEVVILYGGYPFKDDTWVYNLTSNTWTNMNPQGSTPGERWDSAMVYDTVHEVAILFGGRDGSGPKDDTWVYNITSNSWIKMNCTNKPGARSTGSMVYDLTYNVVVLFGGGSVSEGYKGDTWVYNLTSNTWTNMNPQGNKPDLMSQYGMIYDAVHELTVIFGGFDSNEYKNDTWVYNLMSNTWTNKNPQGSVPAARSNLGMVYDAANQVAVIFGGSSDSGMRDDTWIYNLTSNTWTNMNPLGTKPSKRWVTGMVYDTTQEVAILFGGNSGSPLAMDDTWVYNLKRLEGPVLNQITPSPSVTGAIDLSWNEVSRATYYKLYQDTSYIFDTSILTPIATITDTVFKVTLSGNGNYYFTIVAVDVPLWRAESNCEGVEVVIDSIAPIITIIAPREDRMFGTTAPDFNIEIIDENLSSMWYSLDGGTTTIIFSELTGKINQIEWDKMGHEMVTIIFYANDTANNTGQAEVVVGKDLIAPIITIISPITAEEFEYTPNFEIIVDEDNLDMIWYTIDTGAHNYTITSFNGSIKQYAWIAAPDGPVTIQFYAKDEAGNIDTDFVVIEKISPSIPPSIPPEITGYDLIVLIGTISIFTIFMIKRKIKK